MKTRGASGVSGNSGRTCVIEIPSGKSSLRKNPGSVERIHIAFSCFEMVISTTCCRRSARLSPEFTKLTTPLVAALRRRESTPDVKAGKLMPIINVMSSTTTIISTRVTPVSVFPTDNVGTVSLAAGLTVGAVADDVGLIAVLAGVVINIRVFPGIDADVFVGIRPLPVVGVLRLDAQRLQALFSGGIDSGIEFVRSQSRHVRIDLSPRRNSLAALRLADHLGQHQGGEERNDDHHHHFDQRHTSFSSVSLYH